MSRRDEILAAIEGVELLTSPAIGAMQVVNDPDADGDKIARTLEMDAALTTNVLRFANSAYFGCQREIHTVKEAMVRLGMKTITRMLYMSAASQLSKHPVGGYDLAPGQLWSHLISSAVGTELLAKHLKVRAPAYCFTAGLLHDVGKLVLGTFIEVDVDPIRNLAMEENIPFDKAEERILGINHAEVGAVLLKKWNLPRAIVDAVRWHHEPNQYEGDKMVIDLIHTADVISMMAGNGLGVDGLFYAVCPEAEERLKIDRGVVDIVMCELMGEVQKLDTTQS
jgi:putative nucleotidyltransferase with HDIG domain